MIQAQLSFSCLSLRVFVTEYLGHSLEKGKKESVPLSPAGPCGTVGGGRTSRMFASASPADFFFFFFFLFGQALLVCLYPSRLSLGCSFLFSLNWPCRCSSPTEMQERQEKENSREFVLLRVWWWSSGIPRGWVFSLLVVF